MAQGILLQFTGEGRGFMSGVTEYLTFHTLDEDGMREPAPGFELTNEAEVYLPDWFPEESTLKVGM